MCTLADRSVNLVGAFDEGGGLFAGQVHRTEQLGSGFQQRLGTARRHQVDQRLGLGVVAAVSEPPDGSAGCLERGDANFFVINKTIRRKLQALYRSYGIPELVEFGYINPLTGERETLKIMAYNGVPIFCNDNISSTETYSTGAANTSSR